MKHLIFPMSVPLQGTHGHSDAHGAPYLRNKEKFPDAYCFLKKNPSFPLSPLLISKLFRKKQTFLRLPRDYSFGNNLLDPPIPRLVQFFPSQVNNKETTEVSSSVECQQAKEKHKNEKKKIRNFFDRDLFLDIARRWHSTASPGLPRPPR